MITKFRKSDVISSIALGEIISIFIILILKNLEGNVPTLEIFMNFKWLILLVLPALATSGVYVAFILGKTHHVFFQFGKFITIGVSNTAIDFGILNLLIFLTGVKSGYLYSIFKAASFIIAITNSYLWNRFWTFENPETNERGKQLFKFVAVTGVGFIINVSVASFVVNVIEPVAGISPVLWANVGALVSLVFSVLWDFLGFKFIVFKK